MKKLLFALSFLLVLISCASDDDASGGNSIEERILGVWLNSSILVDGVEDLDEGEKDYYKFNADGTVENFYFSTPSFCYMESSTFSFDGSTLDSDLIAALNVEFDGNDKFSYQNIDNGKTVITKYVRSSESELEEEFAGCESEM